MNKMTRLKWWGRLTLLVLLAGQVACSPAFASSLSRGVSRRLSRVLSHSLSAGPAPRQIRQGASPTYYGTQYAADDLYNFDVGGLDAQRVSFRFTAQYSSTLTAIRLYWTDNAQNPGYALGNGGKIQIQIFADSGTPQHIPTGAALATLLFTPNWVNGVDPLGTPDGIWRLLTFPSPAALIQGRIYHLTFTNIDPDAANNYVGVDGFISFGDETQPTLSLLDLGILTDSGNGWTESSRNFASRRPNTITPIISFYYADGNSQGNGYAEEWPHKPRSAAGLQRIRQVIEPTIRVVDVGQVSIRVKREAAGGSLFARIEDAGGQVLATAEFSATLFTTNEFRWVTQTLDHPVTLEPGQTYSLVFSSPNGSYSTFCLGDGQRFGFGSGSVFADGHAEYDLGEGKGWRIWYGWADVGDLAERHGDMQFYLTTNPVVKSQHLPLLLRP